MSESHPWHCGRLIASNDYVRFNATEEENKSGCRVSGSQQHICAQMLVNDPNWPSVSCRQWVKPKNENRRFIEHWCVRTKIHISAEIVPIIISRNINLSKCLKIIVLCSICMWTFAACLCLCPSVRVRNSLCFVCSQHWIASQLHTFSHFPCSASSYFVFIVSIVVETFRIGNES